MHDKSLNARAGDHFVDNNQMSCQHFAVIHCCHWSRYLAPLDAVYVKVYCLLGDDDPSLPENHEGKPPATPRATPIATGLSAQTLILGYISEHLSAHEMFRIVSCR